MLTLAAVVVGVKPTCHLRRIPNCLVIGPLYVDFSISQQEIFFHHEEDLISNLPLEIKIMLPTELSQLKIEQTD